MLFGRIRSKALPEFKACPLDFLTVRYSLARWDEIFDGAPSDAIVPLQSATFGGLRTTILDGVVHGQGTVEQGKFPDYHVGFARPHLTQNGGGGPERALELLNQSITSSDFNPID